MNKQLLLTLHECRIIHHTNGTTYKAYESDKIYQQNKEGGWHGFLIVCLRSPSKKNGVLQILYCHDKVCLRSLGKMNSVYQTLYCHDKVCSKSLGSKMTKYAWDH